MTKYVSPWYNHIGWLGAKHQFTYFVSSIEFCCLVMLFVQGRGGGLYQNHPFHLHVFPGFVQKISSEPPNLL